MAQKVLPCNCAHEFQDKRYGQGKRLHNEGAKAWRCSVCGDEKGKG